MTKGDLPPLGLATCRPQGVVTLDPHGHSPLGVTFLTCCFKYHLDTILWSLSTAPFPSTLNSEQHFTIKRFLNQQILLTLCDIFTIQRRVFKLERPANH